MLELLEEASNELTEAALWYDERQQGLGERFLAEAHAAFGRIEAFPEAGHPWTHRSVPNGARRVLFLTFPYFMVYVLEPRLVVIAVMHARRRPAYWSRRLEHL